MSISVTLHPFKLPNDGEDRCAFVYRDAQVKLRCNVSSSGHSMDEPCCLPENCPNMPEWNGKRVVGWGGNLDAPHNCCLCWEDA